MTIKTKMQNGFSLWNSRQKRLGKANSTGFIPLVIMLLLVIAAVIAVAFIRVYKAQG
jgi:Tfp pilus assembly protein PilX